MFYLHFILNNCFIKFMFFVKLQGKRPFSECLFWWNYMQICIFCMRNEIMIMSVYHSAVRYHIFWIISGQIKVWIRRHSVSTSYLGQILFLDFSKQGLLNRWLSPFQLRCRVRYCTWTSQNGDPKIQLLSRFARSSQDSGDEFNDLDNNHDISRSVVS